LLSEHPETIEREDLPATVPIDRGELITDWVREMEVQALRVYVALDLAARFAWNCGHALYSGDGRARREGILISDVFYQCLRFAARLQKSE